MKRGRERRVETSRGGAEGLYRDRGEGSLAAGARRGAVVVEFAVVLPIVLFLFAAMIEISRLLLLQNTVDAAAYEGARSGMVPGATVEQARASAEKLLVAARLKGGVIRVAPETITEETSLIVVGVEVPVASNAWLTYFGFMPSHVHSTVALVCERPPAVQLTAMPKLRAIDNAIQLRLGQEALLSIGSQATSTSAVSVGLNATSLGVTAAGLEIVVPTNLSPEAML